MTKQNVVDKYFKTRYIVEIEVSEQFEYLAKSIRKKMWKS